MAETSDLEKMRKGLSAALAALGPEPEPVQQPANPAPAAAAPEAPKKRTITQDHDSPLCTDCDTGQKLIVADAERPDEMIRAVNARHVHGDALSCKTCRPALVQTLAGDNYDVDEDDGPGGELRLVPKKKK